MNGVNMQLITPFVAGLPFDVLLSASTGFQAIFYECNQIPSWHFQCFGQIKNRRKCWTLFSTLKGANMAALSSGTFGKLILRERLLRA
jgi:hypothetical protein